MYSLTCTHTTHFILYICTCTLSYVHIQHIWTLVWHTRMCMVNACTPTNGVLYIQHLPTTNTYIQCTHADVRTNLSPGITLARPLHTQTHSCTHPSTQPYRQTRAHTLPYSHTCAHACTCTPSLPHSHTHTHTHAIIRHSRLYIAEGFANLRRICTSRTGAKS